MELHENLYALGQQLGREVFEDPDSFRGALDDFLDEDSATRATSTCSSTRFAWVRSRR